MKNLQEIINEMNNLSEQIAVTLNEEEIKLSDENADVALVADLVPTTTECTTTPNRRVDFCCAVNFPGKFEPEFDKGKINPRIIYDLSCLKVIVEECCTAYPSSTSTNRISVPGYNIRIVGCIPFIVNLPVKNQLTDKICARPLALLLEPTVYACCSGSVCVDNVIGKVCSQRQAILASDIELTCRNVEVKNLLATQSNNPNQCAVIVTGYFELPTIS